VTPDAGSPDAAEATADRDIGIEVFVGSVLLVLLLAFDLDGPGRSPRAFVVVIRTALVLGSIGVLLYALRETTRDHLPGLAATAGAGLLALTMGIAPEFLSLPMGGLGERIWGFPVAIGVPIAGAAFLAGNRVLGGAGCALLLAGLLQPVDIVGDLRLAIAHQPNAGSIILLGLALLGLVSVYLESLSSLAGKLLVGAIPAWEAVRIALAVEGGHSAAPAVAGLLLSSAAVLWLTAGLRPTARQPDWVRHRLPKLTEAGAVLLLCALWLLLKSFTWRWSTTDENIYFYDAVLLSKGVLPYRDFFFAHPPMHIGLPAVLFAVFGFSLPLAKAIPTIAALATGLLCWHMVRDRVGRLAAFLTLGSFLFAFELLQASTNMNGVSLTSVWLTAGLYFLLRDRPATAGAMLGLAVTTGFYAIGGALALLVLAFFSSKRAGVRQLVTFAAVAGGINLLFWSIGGDAYVESVYKFHMLKEEKAKAHVFIKMLYYHTPLVWGVLLAPVLMAWQQLRGYAHVGEPVDVEAAGWFFSPMKLFTERGVGAIKIALLVCVTLLIEFTRFQELYSFYFALLFPTAAICTGFAVASLISAVVHELRELAAGRAKALSLGVVAIAVFWACWIPLAAEANWIFSAKRGKGNNSEFIQAGTTRSYRWIEPATMKSVAGPVVRALFWRDHRTRGHMEPGYRHVLWQKSLHLSVAQEVGDYIREHSKDDETIAGSSLVAPAVALTSGRRLAADIVDTNAKRFKTGLLTLQDYFEAICKDRLRFLVTAPSGYVGDRLAMRLPTVRRQFRPVKRFEDPWNKFLRPGRRVWGVTLWELQNPPTGDGPRCKWIEPQQRRRRAPK